MLSAVLDIVWDITYLVIAISISTGDEFSGEAWITAAFGVAIPAIGAAKVIHELVSAKEHGHRKNGARGAGAMRGPSRRRTRS